MDLKSTRKQVIHAKNSATTYGEVATFAATDAILCGDISVDPVSITAEERKNIQSFFGSQGTINVKEKGTIKFKTEWVGSGAAGTVPRVSPLFKACNFNEVILATAVTGTATAAGSTTTIILAGTASAVDDFYVGMKIAITAGAGSGSDGRIVAYNGTTKTATVSTPFAAATGATSAYSIYANVRYIPHSQTSTNALMDVCFRFNYDGTEHIFLGARGNVKLTAPANKIPVLEWEFTGLVGTITDNAAVAADFTGIPIPVGVMTSNVDDFNCHGLIAPNAIAAGIDIDVGNKVVYPDLIGQDAVLVTDRNVSLKLKLLSTTLAVKNWFAAARGSVNGIFTMTLGNVAGNRVSVVSATMQPKTVAYGDIEGITSNDIDAMLKPAGLGNNDIFFIFD